MAQKQQRILIVDDEPDITALVAYHLARNGYVVTTATNGPDALTEVKNNRPDLVVLDLMLPDLSGYEVLEALKSDDDTSRVGVIMLTARREEPDRIKGLELGADDYVVKPFSPPELVLRVGAVLRRLGSPATDGGATLTVGPITIDRVAHTVQVDGREVDLTVREYELLVVLAERAGRIQSRPRLLEDAWSARPDIQTRTVDMHVKRLRTKLGEPGASMIETVRGFGYRMSNR